MTDKHREPTSSPARTSRRGFNAKLVKGAAGLLAASAAGVSALVNSDRALAACGSNPIRKDFYCWQSGRCFLAHTSRMPGESRYCFCWRSQANDGWCYGTGANGCPLNCNVG